MPTRSVLPWVLELAVRPTPDTAMDMGTGTQSRRAARMATTATLLIPAPLTATTVRTGSLAACSSALVPGSAAGTTVAATTAEATATMAGAAIITAVGGNYGGGGDSAGVARG